MRPELVTQLQLVIAAAAALLLLVFVLRRDGSPSPPAGSARSRLSGRIFTLLLGITALVAGINYFYASRGFGTWIHRWDLFHTVTAVRYFDELGYTGLYECAYVLDAGEEGNFARVDRMRDLRTLRYVDPQALLPESDCQSRFSPERRQAFLEDLRFWNELMPGAGRWRRLFKDKGYNGTPYYTVLMKVLFQGGALTKARLTRAALLDVLLLLTAFLFVARSFGLRVALVAFVFFCVNFPNRFVHMGGSALRFGYLASLMIGLCMLKEKRYGVAGVLFALAGMERIFPFLFAAGLALKGAYDSLRLRRIPPEYLRFFGAFAATVAVGVAVSIAVTGRDSWPAFFANMELHNRNSAGFRIGFRHLFMFAGNMAGSEGFVAFSDKTAIFRSRLPLYLLCTTGFLAALVALIRRLKPYQFAILFGLLCFYLFFNVTRYYYSVLVLIFLLGFDVARQRRFAVSWLLLFAISAGMFWALRLNPFSPFLYNALFSTLMLGYWLFLLAALFVRDAPAPSREPRVAPVQSARWARSWLLPALLALLVVSAYGYWFTQRRTGADRRPIRVAPQRLSRPLGPGTRWNAPGTLVLSPGGVSVGLGRPRRATDLVISFDGNDRYALRYRLAGREIASQSVERGPDAAGGAGLALAKLVVPEAALQRGFDEIEIRPDIGDGRYSIGHLVLLQDQRPAVPAPFFASQPGLAAFARFAALALESAGPPLMDLGGMGLGEPCLGAYAALREGGQLQAAAWTDGGSLYDCVLRCLDALREGAGDRRGSGSVELDVVLVEHPYDLAGRGKAPGNSHRGMRGLKVEFEGKVLRLSPQAMIARNLSFDKALDEACEKFGVSEGTLRRRAKVWTTESVQILLHMDGGPRAAIVERSNTLVPMAALTATGVAELGASLGAWLAEQVHADGRMTYKYWPSRGEEALSNNMIRQWMATLALVRLAESRGDSTLFAFAERNIRYNLSRFYREEQGLGLIEWNDKVKLGALSLAALALTELPNRQPFEQQRQALIRASEHLQQPDGAFVTFYKPAGRNDNQNFYPGETLLLWAALYRETQDPALLERILSSFRYYRRWHREQRNPAFVPWHTQAYYALWRETGLPELRDFIFEMNDWLLGMQQWQGAPYPDMQGRFFDPARSRFGPPHASANGVYLEGLIDAWSLARDLGDSARQETYRRAILRGLRWVMQLQFADEVDMVYVSKPERVRGGLRTTVYDNTIRVDNVQHNLMAVLKILTAFQAEDYHR